MTHGKAYYICACDVCLQKRITIFLIEEQYSSSSNVQNNQLETRYYLDLCCDKD